MKRGKIEFNSDKMCESFNKKTPIQEFYSGKCILITGGTGFLGKILLERLLTMCVDIETIYLMIRRKKGKCIETRLEYLLDSPIFSMLTCDFNKKIKSIEVDLGEPNMALNPDDRSVLIDKVNIVFHCAATVRFDEKLKHAMKNNVIATTDVIDLCKEMKNIEAYVHVSTAFAHCDKGFHTEEVLYKPPLNIKQVNVLAKEIDEKILDVFTPSLLKGYENSYAFTKSTAEAIVGGASKHFPIVIFRPGIIAGTTGKHPVPGFVDNLYAASGITYGAGMGVIRVLNMNNDTPSHIVPVDYCANVMIAAGWNAAVHKQESPAIYNYVAPSTNVMTWGKFCRCCELSGDYMPTSDGIWFARVILVKNRLHYILLFTLLQLIPALLIDTATRLAGKKPILLSTQRRLKKALDVIRFYVLNKFSFQLDGIENLRSRMSKEDGKLFYTDLDDIDWNAFVAAFVYGVRTYLKKEDPSNILQARKRHDRFRIAHYTLKFTFILIGIYVLWRYIQTFVNERL